MCGSGATRLKRVLITSTESIKDLLIASLPLFPLHTYEIFLFFPNSSHTGSEREKLLKGSLVQRRPPYVTNCYFVRGGPRSTTQPIFTLWKRVPRRFPGFGISGTKNGQRENSFKKYFLSPFFSSALTSTPSKMIFPREPRSLHSLSVLNFEIYFHGSWWAVISSLSLPLSSQTNFSREDCW